MDQVGALTPRVRELNAKDVALYEQFQAKR